MKISVLFSNIHIFLVFFLWSVSGALAQEEKESISFLLNELPTATDERKVDILNQLALRTEDLEQAKKYALDALTSAQNMDYKDGIAAAHIGLGEANRYIVHHVLPTDSLSGLAQKYATSVESIMLSSNLLDEAVFEGQILKIQTITTTTEAENYFLKALEKRKSQNFADGQVWALQRLGKLWETTGNIEKAEKYYAEMLKVRELEAKNNPSGFRNALCFLSNFYFKRAQKEKVPSEKAFFIRKEDEMRDKMSKIRENNLQEHLKYLHDVINTGVFYWEQRKQVNKAEKYYKKAVNIAKERKKHEDIAYNRLWDFYKKQGRIYFATQDFDLAEQFLRNYVQCVEDYHSKADSLANLEIGNAYLSVADFYKQAGNPIGNEIYTLKAVATRLKLNDKNKEKWLKDRILLINNSPIDLDSLARLRVRAFYSDDFKNLLAYLPLINHQEIKALSLQTIIRLGTFLGKSDQMNQFYQGLIKNATTPVEAKVKLHFSIIEIIDKEKDMASELNKNYQQIIGLTEPIQPKNSVHFLHLAKSYHALGNKPKAIDNAWKAIRNAVATQPNQPVVNLSLRELQEAKSILAALMKFDEITDTTFIVHTVEKGETLSDLQQFYNVSEQCLKEWNYVDSNELIEGMKLKVCKKADWVRNRKGDENLPPNTSVFHVIKSGDSLESIAQKYKKTVAQLQSYNNHSLNNIFLGQKICVDKYFMQCGCNE